MLYVKSPYFKERFLLLKPNCDRWPKTENKYNVRTCLLAAASILNLLRDCTTARYFLTYSFWKEKNIARLQMIALPHSFDVNATMLPESYSHLNKWKFDNYCRCYRRINERQQAVETDFCFVSVSTSSLFMSHLWQNMRMLSVSFTLGV